MQHTLARLASRRWFSSLRSSSASAPLATAQRGGSIETSAIFEALELKPGSTVGEIGAGNGELSLGAARIVGADGKVLTSELGDEQIKRLQAAVTSSGLHTDHRGPR